MKKNKAHSNLLNSYQKLINISCDLASELDLNILLSKIVNAASEISDSDNSTAAKLSVADLSMVDTAPAVQSVTQV